MQRVTIVLDEEMLNGIDELGRRRGYQNRSEAVRDLVRDGLRQAAESDNLRGDCVAALVYVCEHGARNLTKRVSDAIHGHHDMTIAALHVPLDHDNRLEIAVLRGGVRHVRDLGEHVIAERGIRHGRLVMLPAEFKTERHTHGRRAGHEHLHVRIRDAG